MTLIDSTPTASDAAVDRRGPVVPARRDSRIRPFLISSVVLLACAGAIGIAAASTPQTTSGSSHSEIVGTPRHADVLAPHLP
jgi:hypothetical protein